MMLIHNVATKRPICDLARLVTCLLSCVMFSCTTVVACRYTVSALTLTVSLSGKIYSSNKMRLMLCHIY